MFNEIENNLIDVEKDICSEVAKHMNDREFTEANEKLYMLTSPKLIEDAKKSIRRVIKYLMEDQVEKYGVNLKKDSTWENYSDYAEVLRRLDHLIEIFGTYEEDETRSLDAKFIELMNTTK